MLHIKRNVSFIYYLKYAWQRKYSKKLLKLNILTSFILTFRHIYVFYMRIETYQMKMIRKQVDQQDHLNQQKWPH